MSIEPGMIIAFTGNLAPQQRFSVCHDEKFLKVVELLRSADVSFTTGRVVSRTVKISPPTWPETGAAQPTWRARRIRSKK
jgi:hypothetical protein